VHLLAVVQLGGPTTGKDTSEHIGEGGLLKKSGFPGGNQLANREGTWKGPKVFIG